MTTRLRTSAITLAAAAVLVLAAGSSTVRLEAATLVELLQTALHFGHYSWTEVTHDAEWSPRAGLQVVELHNRFFLLGGRTPKPPSFPPVPGDSVIWDDVWTSADRGKRWRKVAEGQWPARAYFEALTKDGSMYVLGGQNFKAGPAACGPVAPSCSDFFNDVWRSEDGRRWRRLTADAGWEGRAGLSAVVHRGAIYVMGGSKNDDSSIIGGPPARVYFNDVWRSYDGRVWRRMAEHAPWRARAGAVALEKNGWIYVLGGEEGFVCDNPAKPCPPYFNDVWRSRDGESWELVTPAAGWQARPGHRCEVLLGTFVCFGGFGLFGNPADVWVSRNGAQWRQVSDSPWNVTSPDAVKYDFATLAVSGGPDGLAPSIYTFGGDRETFDFFDPTNYLRVDNDVWRFSRW